jgi:hypothetical protein
VGDGRAKVDEYTNRSIRVPFPQDTCPPFDQWLDGCNFESGWGDSMVDGFAEVVSRLEAAVKPAKRPRTGDDRRATRESLFYHTTECLGHIAEPAVVFQDALRGAEGFGVDTVATPRRSPPSHSRGRAIRTSFYARSHARRTTWTTSRRQTDSCIVGNHSEPSESCSELRSRSSDSRCRLA